MWIVLIILSTVIACIIIFASPASGGNLKITGGGGGHNEPSHECRVGNDMLDWARTEMENQVSGAGTGEVKDNKQWRTYKKWSDLKAAPIAYKEYLRERERLIKNPAIDWTSVVNTLTPKLAENREYLFLIDVKNGRAEVTDIDASSSDAKQEKDSTTFASVDFQLYKKFSNIPALIIGHTHPADIECNPMPSSTDLYLTITKGANSQYAGEVVFSRYGVLFYGLESDLSEDLIKNDFPKSVDIYAADLIMAHESMRSWGLYSLRENVDFFRKYRLYFYVFPSPEFVAVADKPLNKRILNHAIDLELITYLVDRLNEYD